MGTHDNRQLILERLAQGFELGQLRSCALPRGLCQLQRLKQQLALGSQAASRRLRCEPASFQQVGARLAVQIVNGNCVIHGVQL
jgi:hypothetical protein